jgi:hypothetical protein
LEKSLSEQYQQRLSAHSEEINRRKETVFPSLGSPTEEAYFDLDRFMAKYFLDRIHGQPARKKTKEPIVLEDFCHESELQKAVQAIPGLAAHITKRIKNLVMPANDLPADAWTDLENLEPER